MKWVYGKEMETSERIARERWEGSLWLARKFRSLSTVFIVHADRLVILRTAGFRKRYGHGEKVKVS